MRKFLKRDIEFACHLAIRDRITLYEGGDAIDSSDKRLIALLKYMESKGKEVANFMNQQVKKDLKKGE